MAQCQFPIEFPLVERLLLCFSKDLPRNLGHIYEQWEDWELEQKIFILQFLILTIIERLTNELTKFKILTVPQLVGLLLISLLLLLSVRNTWHIFE